MAKRPAAISSDPTRVMPSTLAIGSASSSGAASEVRPSLAVGQRLGEYEIIELLGKGGMGQVWLARHRTLQRTVALKTTNRWDGAAGLRFEREAQLASTLDHPHIAKLYEFSRDPPFIAFQLIDGAALSGCSEASIRALYDAATAVHYAHQNGVLHRDLKPDNIIVTGSGQAYVLDFGLARPLQADAGDAHLTQSGEVVGTPAYMSPEQAAGDDHLTPQSDIYSLGSILYTLLAGSSPYQGSKAWEVIRKVQMESPLPPGGNRDLETICLKAMAREPLRRYATAQDFADELMRWLRREPVLARRAGLGYRLARSIQRRPTVWALTAALVLAGLAGVGIALALIATSNRHLRNSILADEQRIAAFDDRQRTYALEGIFTGAERRLQELDARLARRLDDAELGSARADVVKLQADLEDGRRQWPQEGIIPCLLGEALLLLNQEQPALAQFDAALATPATPTSERFAYASRAHLDRAQARLQLDFADQMGRLFIFEDERGYMDSAPVAERITGDLQAAGDGQGYRVQVLGLWSSYLKAAQQRNPFPLYVQIHDQAVALAARGGRNDEWAQLLAGVLSPPPRDQAMHCYDACIDRAHNFAQAWLLRAFERLSFGHPVEARADAEEALRRKPDYALAHALWAQTVGADASADELHVAIGHIDRAIAMEPGLVSPYLIRADLFHAQGGWRAAAADALTAIAHAQGNNRAGSYIDAAWSLLADLYGQAGMATQERSCWLHALAHQDARPLLEALARGDGQPSPSEAESALSAAIAVTTTPGVRQACEIRRRLAESFLDQERGADAQRHISWLEAHAPTSYLPTRILEARLASLPTGEPAAVRTRFDALQALLEHALATSSSTMDAERQAALRAMAWSARGQAELACGDLAAAAHSSLEAVTAHPHELGAWLIRLRVLAVSGGQDLRHQALQAALACEAGVAGRGDLAAAEHFLAQVDHLRPTEAAVTAALAAVRARRAEMARALSDLQPPP